LWYKLKTINWVLVASPISTHLSEVRAKTRWLGIKVICGAIGLPADCCISELAL